MEKIALVSDLQNAEVSQMMGIYKDAPPELKADRDVVLVMVSKHGLFLESEVLESFRADKGVVLAAVHNYGGALKYAAEHLKDDREVVKVAVKSCGFGISHASERLKGDRELSFLAIKQTGDAIGYVDPKFRNDREFVLAAIESGDSYSRILKHVSGDLKRDRNIILKAVSKSGRAVEDVPLELVKNDREIILAAVKNYGEALGFASGHLPEPTHYYRHAYPYPEPPAARVETSLANDREVVLAAVTNSGEALKYASKRLQDDKGIVIEATKKLYFCLKYASPNLRDNRDVVLVSVIKNGDSLQYASERLRADCEIVATALACCKICMGSDFKPHFVPMENVSSSKIWDCEEACLVASAKWWYTEKLPLSPRLRADRDFALKAVSLRGDALGLFDARIRKDFEVVNAAVAQSGTAVKHSLLKEDASTEKWKNQVIADPLSISAVPKNTPNYKEIVLAAIAVDGKAFKYVFGTKLNDDKEFILEAVQVEGERTTKDNRVLELASVRLKDDRDVVLAGVRRKPMSFRNASARLRNDPEIALLAAESSCGGLYYASPELLNNKEFVLQAIKKNASNFEHASKNLKCDVDVVTEAVTANGENLRWASKELQSNREVVKTAVSNNGWALKWADPVFRGDRDIVLRAVKSVGDSLQFAAPELCGDPDIVFAAIERDHNAIKWANIKDLVISFLQTSSIAEKTISSPATKTQSEKELLLDALKRKGGSFDLSKASDILKDDEELIIEAMRMGHNVFCFASERLRATRTVVLAALTADHNNIRYVSRDLLLDSAFLSEMASQARAGVLQRIKNGRSR